MGPRFPVKRPTSVRGLLGRLSSGLFRAFVRGGLAWLARALSGSRACRWRRVAAQVAVVVDVARAFVGLDVLGVVARGLARLRVVDPEGRALTDVHVDERAARIITATDVFQR